VKKVGERSQGGVVEVRGDSTGMIGGGTPVVTHAREGLPGTLGHFGVVIMASGGDMEKRTVAEGVSKETIYGYVESTCQDGKDTTETPDMKRTTSQARQKGGAREGGEDG
jgi:hypothetical protein